MQENNPINQLPSEPVIQKPNNFLVVLLSILLFISLVIAGFFAYQTQKLTQELLESRNQNLVIQTPTPIATTDPTMDWKTYKILPIKLVFKYPASLVVASDIKDSTELKADEEYWVAVDQSDVLYMQMFLYKSTKTANDWWNTEGKLKFESLASSIENVMQPKPSVNLSYTVEPTSFLGQQSIEVVVSSDYGSPQTPYKRYLTIFPQNGYIVMISYHDQGTTKSSIEISNQILSTFKFTN